MAGNIHSRIFSELFMGHLALKQPDYPVKRQCYRGSGHMQSSRQTDVGNIAYSPKISPARHMTGDIQLYGSRKIRALVDLSYGGSKRKADGCGSACSRLIA